LILSFSFRIQTCASHTPHPDFFLYIINKNQSTTLHSSSSYSSFNLNLNLSLLYMADSNRNITTTLQKPSRLQKRAPSSLQINRSIQWNVAIPLLSPLSSSPPPQLPDTRPSQGLTAEPEKVIVTFKNWQHPAAPFCHEQAPMVPLRL